MPSSPGNSVRAQKAVTHDDEDDDGGGDGQEEDGKNDAVDCIKSTTEFHFWLVLASSLEMQGCKSLKAGPCLLCFHFVLRT